MDFDSQRQKWSWYNIFVIIDSIHTLNLCLCSGYEVIVRVMLKNGACHEDIGYGTATNLSSDMEAFEKAVSPTRKKEFSFFKHF